MTIAAMDWQRRLSDAEISEVVRKRHERARRRELSDPLLRLNLEIKERQDRREDERKLLELNPMNEPFWALGMALAWVCTRDPLIVAKMWERWEVRNVNSGTHLELLLTFWSADNGVADAVTSHGACEEVFDAARQEKLVITAIRASGGRAPVPPDQWNDIGVPPENYDELPWKLGRIPANGPSMAGRFPLMERDDVVALWPPQAIEQSEPSFANSTSTGAVSDSSAGAMRPRPTSRAVLKRATLGCIEFAHQRQILSPTRAEMTDILQRAFEGAGRKNIRAVMDDPEVIGHFPRRRGPRGPINSSRDNELAEIRQFLSAANWRN